MATKRAPATKQQPMAYVEVGYTGYLVPLADGQRLVAILAGAVKARQNYHGRSHVYEVEQGADPVHASLAVVHPDQIVAIRPQGERGDMDDSLALSHELLKLGGPRR